MIYVCITAHDNASTVGLVLWKVRQVFEEFRRDYHLLVADDGSSDETADVLEPYERALPLTVLRWNTPRGYASSLERLVHAALKRTDRPRRDCLITLPADFSISPAILPDLVKRVESGADVVVAEALDRNVPSLMRLVRRTAPWLLRPGLRLRGFRDVLSGAYAFRLMTLKNCLKERSNGLLEAEGPCANPELLARAAAVARQIAAVQTAITAPPRSTTSRDRPLSLAFSLFRAGRRLRVPAPQTIVQRVS